MDDKTIEGFKILYLIWAHQVCPKEMEAYFKDSMTSQKSSLLKKIEDKILYGNGVNGSDILEFIKSIE